MEVVTKQTAHKLHRVLGLWDLILYGIILIMPIAAVPLFGIVQQLSAGQAVTTILLAMVAMTLTAYSYGRMASLYPSAGSAYTYVSRGLNPHCGFLAGWAMLLDYLLVPVVCIIYATITIQRVVPGLPYWLLCLAITALITLVNAGGIRATSTVNLLMMLATLVVIVPFILLAIHWLFVRQGWPGVISTLPFYSPHEFRWSHIATGTALAALTYGGFDGVSTLSEEVVNPKRNILLATVFVCIFTGVFSGLQIYLAQRVHPSYTDFTNPETAFMDVTREVGGPLLFRGMAAILIMTNLGTALAAQAGVSRLLYGMGRDSVLPRRVFAYLSPARATPLFNILLIGLLAFGGCMLLNYERAAELVNFGAFLAFMGVNASALRTFGFTRKNTGRRWLVDMFMPAAGFIFCFVIWLNLSKQARIVGGCWFLVGLVYDAIISRGFQRTPAGFDPS